MTLYTRHGFVITEDEGEDSTERPPVDRCGGIGWCSEDSADYLAWRSRKFDAAAVDGDSTLSTEEALDYINRFQYSRIYTHAFDMSDHEQGFYEAMTMVKAILQGDQKILNALEAFPNGKHY